MKRTFSFHFTNAGLTACVTYTSTLIEGFGGITHYDNKLNSVAISYAGHMINVTPLLDDLNDTLFVPMKLQFAMRDDAEKQWKEQQNKRATVETAAQM